MSGFLFWEDSGLLQNYYEIITKSLKYLHNFTDNCCLQGLLMV